MLGLVARLAIAGSVFVAGKALQDGCQVKINGKPLNQQNVKATGDILVTVGTLAAISLLVNAIVR